MVADADDRAPCGLVAVTIGTAAGAAEVGYWTATQARKQGVAARALETVSRWALGTQNMVPLTRLDLFHTTTNQASCRVAVMSGYPLRDLLPATPPAFPSRPLATPGRLPLPAGPDRVDRRDAARVEWGVGWGAWSVGRIAYRRLAGENAERSPRRAVLPVLWVAVFLAAVTRPGPVLAFPPPGLNRLGGGQESGRHRAR
ncbi:hypothetical protein Adu01nite_66800 [Paractinoplanes durhamensis]|uniref:N-acetyltransferase domain-containing protein n=1 Tax=Paractinoplanes durhamensis TaxID=113563 RepID=A0ABQ3Z669_9ACTN|nr:hypothetical protein Adu01nite_66800 [Actinoplanes durhamensis]